jgi:hypothetical protein
MKVNMPNQPQQSNTTPKEGGVFIDWNNMKKEKVRLDKDGNEIDPRTKQIIKRNTDPS